MTTRQILFFYIASVFCVIGAMGFLVFVLGPMIDGVAHRSEEHDRCLKNATNGYEIKQCR